MKKSFKTLKDIYELYNPFHKTILGVIILALAVQTMALIMPFLTGKLIDGITKNSSTKSLVFIATGIAIAKFLEIGIGYWSASVKIKRLGKNVGVYIRDWASQKVTKLSIGQVINENSGYRQNILQQGETAVIDIANLLSTDLLPVVAKTLVTIVTLAFISPPVCALSLLGFGIYLVVTVKINSEIVEPMQKLSKTENRLNKKYSEILRNMKLVLTNAQEERTLNDYTEKRRSYANEFISMWLNYNRKSFLTREPIVVLTLFSTTIGCIYLNKNWGYSAGKIVTIMTWTAMLIATLGKAGQYQRNLLTWLSQAHLFFEMLDIPSAVTMVKHPTRPEKMLGRIEFKNVSFRYPKNVNSDNDEVDQDQESEKGVLHNVSFCIEPGETCAFVAHSGAGKSTIIDLLIRAYDPDEGQILIDGIDLRLIDLNFLRQNMGSVEQKVILWDGSLRDNINYCILGERGEITDAEMESLAQRACIDRFYPRLGKKRFDTWIGENGIKLSGGEQQRVAIARALAKNPSILIFDEATNSLDKINESLVQHSIKESLKGRTGIIIAHSLPTIRHAQKIIALEKGRVVGIGSHSRLLDDCEEYRELVESGHTALLN